MGFKKKFGVGTAAVASCGVVALLVSASPGVATEGFDYNDGNQISSTVRKSVSVTSDANGQVNNSIMVTQVSSVGKGQTTINVPVNATSARNLDGFGGTTVNNKEAVFNLNLNGNQEQRIMTNSGPGPIEITAEATLDGKPIQPSEVVNKTGVLKVKYTVVNTEKQVVDVNVRDDKGNETVEQQEIDAPIGGSVAITLPQGFNEITAPGANMGGDGQGGTKLSYSLVMFKPLGDPVATVEYESRISNGTIPEADFTMIPIVPLENSTIKTARSSFETGVQTGDKIADAGKQIGDGAGQLATGVGTAASGAQELADGLSGKLLPGANALAAGSNELATKLAAGAKSAPALVEGVDAIYAGVKGDPDNPDPTKRGLVPSLKSLKDSFTKPAPPAEGIPTLLAGAGLVSAGTPSAKGGIALLGGLCPTAVETIGTLLDVWLIAEGRPAVTPGNAATYDIHNFRGAPGTGGKFDAVPEGTSCTSTQTALTTYATGAGGVADGTISAMGKLQAGVDAIYAGVTFVPPAGSKQNPGLEEALRQLAAQAPALVTGMQAAADGAGKLADGAAQLADGVPAAADGAQQLADGLPAAVDGAEKLSAGGKELEASGQAAAGTFASQVNAIDAVQKLGVEGVGIPNGGKATGENVSTTGAYQITLQAAMTPEQNNGLRFGLAALALIVAGGAGTAIYRRRHGSV